MRYTFSVDVLSVRLGDNLMSAPSLSLLDVLSQIEDCRSRHGRRHPLSAILAMAVAATLCGSKSYGAMAEWGRNYGAAIACALGFTRSRTPCAATLHALFRRMDRQALEEALSRWAASVLAALPPEKGKLEAVAIDGKTLRGAQQQGALEVHLLSVLSHRLGLTLAQRPVPDPTNEIGALPQILADLVLKGQVVTVDAMHCQKETAQTIVERGGTT
jgi:hypothetical protein